MPYSFWTNMPDRFWAKIPDSFWTKMPDSFWAKMPDSFWANMPYSFWGNMPDSFWAKMPYRFWAKMPDSFWANMPDSFWDKMPDSFWAKMPASFWTKMPYSFWAKMPDAPLIKNPYIILWEDIKNKNRKHDQNTFGEIKDYDPNRNICGTAMCTAGHLVNMAGKWGYDMANKYGFAITAFLLHKKAHPNYPAQNFGSPTQESAMAYIEWMAENEKDEAPDYENRIG